VRPSTERAARGRPRLRRSAALLLALSVALFLASLAAPAFYFGEGNVPRQALRGLDALSTGWFAALFGLLGLLRGSTELLGALVWFVNPLLLLAWIQLWRGRQSAALQAAVPALLLALTFFWVRRIPSPDSPMEGVVPNVGYLVWVFSIVAAIVAAVQLEGARSEPLRTHVP
jgi:hypothetical protein